jgi:hypothetical protein
MRHVLFDYVCSNPKLFIHLIIHKLKTLWRFHDHQMALSYTKVKDLDRKRNHLVEY